MAQRSVSWVSRLVTAPGDEGKQSRRSPRRACAPCEPKPARAWAAPQQIRWSRLNALCAHNEA